MRPFAGSLGFSKNRTTKFPPNVDSQNFSFYYTSSVELPSVDHFRSCMKFRSAIPFLLATLLLGACANEEVLNTQQTSSVASSSEAGFTLQEPGAYRLAYAEEPVMLKDSLHGKKLLQNLDINLTSAEQQYLETHKFLVIPSERAPRLKESGSDPMLASFDALAEEGRLMNPDIILHAYNRYLENTLVSLEQSELRQLLASFIRGMQENAIRAMQAEQGEAQKRYQQIAMQLTVARVLLENSRSVPSSFSGSVALQQWMQTDQAMDTKENALSILAQYESSFPQQAREPMRTELRLIYTQQYRVPSPLFAQYKPGSLTDYKQYIPTGHYTFSSALRSYFRTMQFLQQGTYFFARDIGVKDANLLSILSRTASSGYGTPREAWQKVKDIIAFYNGSTGDVSLIEWETYVSSVTGGATLHTSASALNPDTIRILQQRVGELGKGMTSTGASLGGPQVSTVLPKSKEGLRLFGEHYGFDAWALFRLTKGRDGIRLPTVPSLLFVSAVLGDDRAREHAREYVRTYSAIGRRSVNFTEEQVQSFVRLIDQTRQDLGKMPGQEWSSSSENAWLWLLASLTHTYGEGYPLYMQSLGYLDKQLQTFLGSYTERQGGISLAAPVKESSSGSTTNNQVVAKGFVEPNADFWWKLRRVTKRTKDFFTQQQLFVDHPARKTLQEFATLADFLSMLSQKELMGIRLTDSEYTQLQSVRLSPFGDSFISQKTSARSPVLYMLHTDDVTDLSTYEGLGKPFLMLALVGNESSPRLVVGLVFHHLEFTTSVLQPWKEADFQNTAEQNPSALPAKNAWAQ